MKSKEDAKLRGQKLRDFLKSDIEKRLGTNTGIKRYRVQEFWPAHEDSGYYSQSYPEKVISNSEWFDSEEKAQQLLDKSEPDREEYKLRIVSQTLYRKHVPEHYEEKWV